MGIKMIDKLLPLILIAFAVISRILPHPANFAPIAAIGLFSGVYLPKKYGLILPFLAMLISDYFIGFYGFTMLFVYGSYFLVGLIGIWLRGHKNALYIIGSSVVSSVIFFLITNFGVWIDPVSSYPKDFSGLIQSYIMGIPFFRGTVLGDLFFTAYLFGGYELIKNFIHLKLAANQKH